MIEEACNTEWAIERAKRVSERYREVLVLALKAAGEEWRSPDLQVAMLTGAIAAELDASRSEATMAERERCATVAEHLNGWGGDCGRGDHAMHIASVIRQG